MLSASSLGLALLVLATAEPARLATLADVLALLDAGRAETEVVAAIEASSLHVRLAPEEAIRLHFDGMPASVLAALYATTGSPHPRVAVDGAQLELGYDGYRILGRMGPDGPVLVVSGYGSDGERLAPPVESPPPAAASAPAPASEDRSADLRYADRRDEAPPLPVADDSWGPDEVSAQAAWLDPQLIAGDGEPRSQLEDVIPASPALDPVYGPVVSYDPLGSPDYVTVSRIPPAYLSFGTLVLPIDAPAYGLAHYGRGTPFYGPWGPYASASSCGTAPIGYPASAGTATRPAAPPPGRSAADGARGHARTTVIRDRIRHR